MRARGAVRVALTTGFGTKLGGYPGRMAGRDHPRLVRTPQTDPPAPGVERRRRLQAAVASLAGTAVGIAVGVIAAELIAPGAPYLAVGLGAGLAIVGFVAGGLVAETRAAPDVDAPVRDPEGAWHGGAATDPRGQLADSPVAPDHAPARDTTSRLPSQRDVNDPEGGRAVPGTEWRPTESDP